MRWIFLALIFAAVVVTDSARADEISSAERSVVRVVIITFDSSGEPVGIGHGSGFAVATNRIVTSAHVIQAPIGSGALIYAVSASSSRGMKAYPVYVDRSSDLALLRIDGTLPELTVYNGQTADGASVFALGFPGNVDLATSRSLSDYLGPKDAIRTQGNLANKREIMGIDAVLHTAGIARGNSGGPLLDECGRVVGVNSFTTTSGNGDAPFGFAISNEELLRFLHSAKQVISEMSAPCQSRAERLAAEREEAANAREREEQASSARERAERDAQMRRLEVSRHEAENWIAISILLGAVGLACLGAGGAFFVKDRVQSATAFSGVGALLMVTSAGTFFYRPSPIYEPAGDGAEVTNQFENGSSSSLPQDNTIEPPIGLSDETARSNRRELPFESMSSDDTDRHSDIDPEEGNPTQKQTEDEEIDYTEGL